MHYRDLIVWQKAFLLTTLVYKITNNFPRREDYSLTSQIRRSAISIPSNIAEGFGRVSKKYFAQFLRIALGSVSELETQLLLSVEIKYIDESDLKDIKILMLEVQKILGSLIKKNS